MKKLIPIAMLLSLTYTTQAQKYFTKKGKITFYSKTKAEDIDAVNNRVTSVFDKETGEIEFAVLITAFEFKKALMQEHFNENYMESTKYPKAVFSGKINDISSLKLDTDGTYTTNATGELTMHGVTKTITENVTFTVSKGNISATCDFKVMLKDYKIKIPKAVGMKIAEQISVSVVVSSYELLKK